MLKYFFILLIATPAFAMGKKNPPPPPSEAWGCPALRGHWSCKYTTGDGDVSNEPFTIDQKDFNGYSEYSIQWEFQVPLWVQSFSSTGVVATWPDTGEMTSPRGFGVCANNVLTVDLQSDVDLSDGGGPAGHVHTILNWSMDASIKDEIRVNGQGTFTNKSGNSQPITGGEMLPLNGTCGLIQQ